MRLLVTGAAGFIGHAFVARHGSRFEILPVVHRSPLSDRSSFQVDLANEAQTLALFERARPQAVLHLAALSRIEDCERDPGLAHATNVLASERVARLAAERGARLVHVSTDLVFGGDRAPYREDDPVRPVSEYGRSKARAEEAVLSAGGGALVCRVALTYGPAADGKIRPIDWVLRQAEAGRPVQLFVDEFRTPIDLFTLTDVLAELVEMPQTGILHVAGTERWSRYDLGRAVLRKAGMNPELARPGRVSESPTPRAPDVSLDTTRARALLSTPLVGLEVGLSRVFGILGSPPGA